MKLVSFETKDGRSYGRMDGDRILDAGRLRERCPDLKSALASGAFRELAGPANGAAAHDAARLRLLPPIPDPAKIFCIGVNYRTHLVESGHPEPKHPMVFLRLAASQVASGAPLIRPHESERFDFEGELAVVIGKPGRRIPRDEALAHVAGYSCYNDGSIRDFQRHTSQFTPGKNFAGTGAFGPWIVTADELPDIQAATLVTRLNGEEMQRAPISDLVFDVPALIAYLSVFTPLEAGDIIVTGTTGGVGAYRVPPVWMKGGDTVEVEISGIGVLRNPVVDESAA